MYLQCAVGYWIGGGLDHQGIQNSVLVMGHDKQITHTVASDRKNTDLGKTVF